MKTKIQKWGNSLGLRIPKAYADEAGVKEGSVVDVSVSSGELVVRPLRRRAYKLRDLLAGVTKKNLHDEIPTGRSRGAEVW